MLQIEETVDRVLSFLKGFDGCAVAFSGGVDSAVVAKAAQLALKDRAVAVTAVSPSLAAEELSTSRQVAKIIGIRHEILQTRELENPEYSANSPRRCYHCKNELYAQIHKNMGRWHTDVMLNGANLDDCEDYRPGLEAAADWNVRSPLAECGLHKADVRRLAKYWELPVWNKPATPCLSSRIAYGEEVNEDRLAMIDRAEQYLRKAGYGTVRVRYHKGDLARIEVPGDRVGELGDPKTRERLITEFHKMGFRYVCLDLEGFRSGSQNLVLPLSPKR